MYTNAHKTLAIPDTVPVLTPALLLSIFKQTSEPPSRIPTPIASALPFFGRARSLRLPPFGAPGCRLSISEAATRCWRPWSAGDATGCR